MLAILVMLAVGAGCATTHGAGPSPGANAANAVNAANAAALRVMTFNIRYGSAPDGADAWPLRRDLALRAIGDFGPVVLGVQEALRFQLDEIAHALPQYGEVGVGRDDGVRAGEYAAILYDRRRLTLHDQGWFWLSDTPEVPGSMTWGNRYPRIVTWARFADRVSGESFCVFNTHWDHESQVSRERSAQLLLKRIAARVAAEDPVLLVGDFNVGPDNPAFEALIAFGNNTPGAVRLVDTFRVVHPLVTQQIGTFHTFRGDRGGAKIDAVLASPEWQVLAAGIQHTSENGRYPSDHFPVTAIVVLRRDWAPRLGVRDAQR